MVLIGLLSEVLASDKCNYEVRPVNGNEGFHRRVGSDGYTNVYLGSVLVVPIKRLLGLRPFNMTLGFT